MGKNFLNPEGIVTLWGLGCMKVGYTRRREIFLVHYRAFFIYTVVCRQLAIL